MSRIPTVAAVVAAIALAGIAAEADAGADRAHPAFRVRGGVLSHSGHHSTRESDVRGGRSSCVAYRGSGPIGAATKEPGDVADTFLLTLALSAGYFAAARWANPVG